MVVSHCNAFISHTAYGLKFGKIDEFIKFQQNVSDCRDLKFGDHIRSPRRVGGN